MFVTDGAATFGIVPVTPNWYPCLARARPKSTGLSETPFMAVVMSNTVAIPATSLNANVMTVHEKRPNDSYYMSNMTYLDASIVFLTEYEFKSMHWAKFVLSLIVTLALAVLNFPSDS